MTTAAIRSFTPSENQAFVVTDGDFSFTNICWISLGGLARRPVPAARIDQMLVLADHDHGLKASRMM
jgi:hypothetical protein